MKTTANYTKFLVLFTLVLFFANSCKKDDVAIVEEEQIIEKEMDTITENKKTSFESEEAQIKRIESVLSTRQVLTDVVVTVFDNNDNLQPNVEVTLKNNVVTTDESGIAIFQNMKVNERYVFTKAIKPGYVKAMKTVVPTENGITNIAIMLREEKGLLKLNSENGGEIARDGVVLDFPAGAIIDTDGNTYSGETNVDLIYFNMENEDGIRNQPGILSGITLGNQETGLVSKGMVTVNLTDTNGNALNIGNGKSVSVTMPAVVNSPETIALWHLNESYGIWMEMGEAVKNGERYEFEVSHFSTYNLDFKIPNPFDFSVNIKYTDQTPASNQLFYVTWSEKPNQSISTFIYADDKGTIRFLNGGSGPYNFDSYGCDFFSGTTIDVPSEGAYDVFIEPRSERTNLNLEGVLIDCNNKVMKNQFFSLDIEGIPFNPLRGRTGDNGYFNIHKSLCGTYSGVRNAVITVTTPEGTHINSFAYDLRFPKKDIPLSTCGPIRSLRFNDPLSIDVCISEVIRTKNGEVEGERETPYLFSESHNITEIGSSCSDFISCFDFSNLQQLYYFPNLETLAFSIPDAVSEMDFLPLANLKKLKKVIVVDNYDDDRNEYEEIVQELQLLLPNTSVELVEDCRLIIQ